MFKVHDKVCFIEDGKNNTGDIIKIVVVPDMETRYYVCVCGDFSIKKESDLKKFEGGN